SSDTIEQIGIQSNRDLRFNVYAAGSRYNFTGRISRGDSVSSSRVLNGDSRGSRTNYNASLLWREPAFPVVSVQYIRNVSDNSSNGSKQNFVNSTWMLSSYYDLDPLRFTFDRSVRTFDNSGQQSSQTTIQRSSIQMNQELMRGMIFTGELSRYTTSFDASLRASSTSSNTGLFRVSLMPTQSVIASIDLSNQSTEQKSIRRVQQTDFGMVTFNVRAQVMPELSLDFSNRHQSQTGKVFNSSSRTESNSNSWNLGINGQLADGTSINGSLSNSTFDVGILGNRTSQNSAVLSLLTDLTRTTDLNANVGQETSRIGLGQDYVNRFAGVSLRDHASRTLSLGAAVRWSDTTSPFQNGTRSRQTSNAVNFDALWLPTQRVGLNVGVIYQVNNGANSSNFFAPELNLRWQVDSLTNLVLGYNLNQISARNLVDSPRTNQRNDGMTFRIDHSFLDGSSLNLAYDFQKTELGSLEWQKQFRLYYSRRL
ncbi:MAG: TonB-dependent receptor, partial [Armatimonadota bacterium]